MRRTSGTTDIPRPDRPARRRVLGLAAALALLAPGSLAAPATAASPTPGDPPDTTIALPGASGAEGIAAGREGVFYAGELPTGDIFRGDVRRETAERFIDAPDGRAAVGMKADVPNNLLFVAGGPTGQAYVYDTGTGETVRSYDLVPPGEGFINDVALSQDGAWFTNSRAGQLFFVPVEDGKPGESRTLALKGPAAETPGDFNLNGIAEAPRDGSLIVAHSSNKALYTVDPETGDSTLIEGVSVPNVDGIVLVDRNLWAVRNNDNVVSRILLDPDLGAGRIVEDIASEQFQIPTTAALFGRTLAVVNAKFGVPDADTYEVVLVDAGLEGPLGCEGDCGSSY